ncbi:hypothetical protein SAMN05444157_1561 [Frankineae bacterium MT45]|nr:hypothetical protein SAMN05444157_1561 [Frankineae bacterium MT45]
MTISGEFVRRFSVVLGSLVAMFVVVLALGSMHASAAPHSNSTEAVPPPCSSSSPSAVEPSPSPSPVAVSSSANVDFVSGLRQASVQQAPQAVGILCTVSSLSPSAPATDPAASSSADSGVDALSLNNSSGSGSSGLASTGVAVLSILGVAVALLIAGLVFMYSGRRRSQHS